MVALRRTRRHFHLLIAYDGMPYHGWQRQPAPLVTVQSALEQTLSRVLNQPIQIRGAGRTDAGVHALGQRASFSADTALDPARIQRALNSLLPESIRLREVGEFGRPMDALRETVRKTYFFQFHVGPFLPPHRRTSFVWAGRHLDLSAMRSAACHLIGEHDFSSFVTEANRQKSCVRTLRSVRVLRIPGGARLFFTGPGFLYNMVRTLSSALWEVGAGRWPVDQVREVLRARDRRAGPPTAPAHGLFLFRVDWAQSVAKALREDRGVSSNSFPTGAVPDRGLDREPRSQTGEPQGALINDHL